MAKDSLGWNAGSEFPLFNLCLNSVSKLQDWVPSCHSSAWTPLAVGGSLSKSGFKLLLKSNSLFLFHISRCRTSRFCPAFPVVLLPTCLHIAGEVQILGWGWGNPSSLIFSSWNTVFRHRDHCSALLPCNDPVLSLWSFIQAAFRAQALQDFPKSTWINQRFPG